MHIIAEKAGDIALLLMPLGADTMSGKNQQSLYEDEAKKEVYLVSEVAAILRMSERSAYNFCANTDAFIVKRCGKLLRVSKDSFDEWLHSK